MPDRLMLCLLPQIATDNGNGEQVDASIMQESTLTGWHHMNDGDESQIDVTGFFMCPHSRSNTTSS